MDESFCIKNLIIPTAILLDSQLLMGQQMAEQPLVEATEADQKYANTTVVFKQKEADDALVLLSLGQSYGVGSVVRIAVAEPKPQPVEVKSPVRNERPQPIASPAARPVAAPTPDESPAPSAARPTAPATAKAGLSTKIMVEKAPQPDATAQKALAEKRSAGLRSPQPIPVKPLGKTYDPHKKGLWEKLPKLSLPSLSTGGRVRCPKP